MALVHHRLLACALALSFVWGAASQVRAQDDELEEDESEEEAVPSPRKVKPAPGPQRDHTLGDEQALEEERAPNERFRETTDPYEDPAKRYAFLGARWNFSTLTPGLLKGFTVENGPTVSTLKSFSAELAFRRKGFQVMAVAGFKKLDTRGPFQLKKDPIEDTEWLNVNFKFFNVTAVVTWSTAFADWFQLEYGLEAGVGFLFGDMIRNEAYKDANGNWHRCDTWASQSMNPDDQLNYNPDFPNPTRLQRQYCQKPDGPEDEPPKATNSATEDGEQYGVRAQRGLFNGGVPRVVPILGPRLSLRFKPIHQFVIRLDVPLPVLPFGIVGGASVQYGF
jgi:hypothetical protein